MIVTFAQPDTLLRYDVRTAEFDKIIVNYPFQSDDFLFTKSNTGSAAGKSSLSTSPPSVFHTNLMQADSLFNVDNYPMRTTVKLYKYENGSIFQACSGTLIAPTLVLTAGHCVCFQYDTSDVDYEFRDSILVVPAFNGKINGSFTNSISKYYYIYKTWYDRKHMDDMALIELNEPIALETGWLAVAYNKNNQFYINNVFHKFSYPMAAKPQNPSIVYNGSKMFYDYGKIELITNSSIGYDKTGITGQSGSTLFYTDNEKYYIVAVMNSSYRSRHFKINKNNFYAISQIIDSLHSQSGSNDINPSQYQLFQNYPNPFNAGTVIKFYIPENKSKVESLSNVKLMIFDILGREIKLLVNSPLNSGEQEIQFNAGGLASGIYIYKLNIAGYTAIKKMLLLK